MVGDQLVDGEKEGAEREEGELTVRGKSFLNGWPSNP